MPRKSREPQRGILIHRLAGRPADGCDGNGKRAPSQENERCDGASSERGSIVNTRRLRRLETDNRNARKGVATDMTDGRLTR